MLLCFICLGHCKQDLSESLTFVDNHDWYEKWNLLDFISKMGRHFRVGKMLTRKSVKSRMELETGLSFTEFTYQVLQAYDWLHLYQKYNCTVQIGGSDQLGNIHAGYDLINRIHNKMVYGITVPLGMYAYL